MFEATKFRDRVLERTTTAGLDTFVLIGTRTGFHRALDVLSDGDECCYVAEHETNGQWELGLGIIGTGHQLTRMTILASSTGAKVDFAAGTKWVRLTLPAALVEQFASLDPATLILADGSVDFTADQSMGGNALTDVADPTNDQDAATKAYVDEQVAEAGGGIAGPTPSTDRSLATWNGTDGDTLRDNPDWTISSAGKMKGKSFYAPAVRQSGSGTITLDLTASNRHIVELTGNATLVVTNLSVDQLFMVRVKQNATGGYTLAWFDGIHWPGGTVPTIIATANRYNWYGFYCTGTGDYGAGEFDGFICGEDYRP